MVEIAKEVGSWYTIAFYRPLPGTGRFTGSLPHTKVGATFSFALRASCIARPMWGKMVDKLGIILCYTHARRGSPPKKLDQYALKKLAVANKQRCLLDNETG
jgi:hypothetical protein